MSPPKIELREVTRANVAAVVRLQTKPEQSRFVATNANSLAEAYVQPDRAWPRAICADGDPVGFLMLDLVGPDHPEAPDGRASYFLWRLMVDAIHQGRGYGRAAMGSVFEHVRGLPDGVALKTSYVPGDGCPEPFYRKLGFEPTGVVEDGEVELRLAL